MKYQINTIRAGVAEFAEGDGQKGLGMILEAVTQLEAMVGEQEPVAWIDGGDLELMRKHGRGCIAWGQEQNNAKTPLYAAPVAQQHVPEADCGNIKAQQPQAEDTIKRQAQKIAELTADRDGWIEAHARLHREYHDFRKAAPQQAKAVPPGCVPVPVEPTEEMLLSARDWSAAKYGKPIGDEAAKGCWGAMLAAAIAQQKGADHG